MAETTIRFYEELNDFLPHDRRKRDLVVSLDFGTSVRNLIASLGVPHVGIDLVLVDGRSVDFDHVLDRAERISVYPVFESLDITNVQRLRPRPLRNPRFVLDVQLGELARRLRLLGLDCLHDERADDGWLTEIASAEDRVLLTRDRGLLRRRTVTRGYWVRTTDPRQQVAEVLDRLDLRRRIQ